MFTEDGLVRGYLNQKVKGNLYSIQFSYIWTAPQWSSGRVLTWCAGGCGFNSWLGHTRDLVLGASLFSIKWKDEKMWEIYPLLAGKCD